MSWGFQTTSRSAPRAIVSATANDGTAMFNQHLMPKKIDRAQTNPCNGASIWIYKIRFVKITYSNTLQKGIQMDSKSNFALALLSLMVAPLLVLPTTSNAETSKAVTAPAAIAPAVTVLKVTYSNLGAGGAFGTGYYFVSGPVNNAYTYAAPFIAGVSGHLSYIDLPLQPLSSNAGVVVSIFPDNAGVPGTANNGPALEEWLAAKLPTPVVAIKFNSSHKPLLIAGQKYWIVVAPLFYDSIVGWQLNTSGQTGVDATTDGSANGWFDYTANARVMPAMDVWVK
jgi:hypothetical protein